MSKHLEVNNMCNLVTTIHENLNWYEAVYVKAKNDQRECNSADIFKNSYEIIKTDDHFTVIKVGLIARILRYLCCDFTGNTTNNKNEIQNHVENTVNLILRDNFTIKLTYYAQFQLASAPYSLQVIETCRKTSWVLEGLKTLITDLKIPNYSPTTIQTKFRKPFRRVSQIDISESAFKSGIENIADNIYNSPFGRA